MLPVGNFYNIRGDVLKVSGQSLLLKAALFLTLWCALAAGVRATSVLPLDLDQIINGAAVAFQGTCTGNRSERDPGTGLIVTYTSFAVTDVLRGGVGPSHTIKQVGGQIGAEVYMVHGVPTFAIGQEYLVFLSGVSGYGFSSPVGLGQGRFSIRSGAAGPEISNGRDFRELLARLPAAALQGTSAAEARNQARELRHLNLDEFKRIVRQHANGGSK